MRKENTNHLKTYILSVLLLALILMVFPVKAQAKIKSGKCGADLYWAYDTDDSTLTISGSGDMYNYSPASEAPWFQMNTDGMDDDFESSQISKVKFSTIYKITGIGDYAFYGLTIYDIETDGKTGLPGSIERIGKRAFAECESLYISKLTLPSALKTIGEGAFSSVPVVEVKLPAACTTIGNYAFSGMGLDYIYIPNTVKSVGKYAFGYYAYGYDDTYMLDDTTPKKDIKKTRDFFVYGPASKISSSTAFKYAKKWGLEYRMKGVKGPKIKSAKNVKTRRIQLKWKKVGQASGYQIRYSTSSKFDSEIAPIKYITVNSKKTTGKKTAKLKKNKTYYISIRYFKKVSGKKVFSEWSAAKGVKIKK